MRLWMVGAALLVAVAACAVAYRFLRPGPVRLAAGVTLLHAEMVLESGAEVLGSGDSVLKAAPDFQGRALIVCKGNGIRLHDFAVEGDEAALQRRSGLPASNVAFARFTHDNAILAEGAHDLRIERVKFRHIAGFAVLASAVKDLMIESIVITNSGTLDDKGHNNTTGGILLEEGTERFTIRYCMLRGIAGNGIWTHSLYTSPRNAHGLIESNRIEEVARDAIQIGHAFDVKVWNNSGATIGFPENLVDAVPVGIDTAGNVSQSEYRGNRFKTLNGKCIDLDGFHDGEVSENTCMNGPEAAAYRFGTFAIVMNNSNPDMKSENVRIVNNTVDGSRFGGIFVIGERNTIEHNRLLRLNLAHCERDCFYSRDQPELLKAGIYLAPGAERPAPARNNTIRDNEIKGFGMTVNCIVAGPGVSLSGNIVSGNLCGDDSLINK